MAAPVSSRWQTTANHLKFDHNQTHDSHRAYCRRHHKSLPRVYRPGKCSTKWQKGCISYQFCERRNNTECLTGGYTYGGNFLTSATKIDGKRGKIEFLGVVNYKDGSGPFGGFVTVTLDNGSILGLAVDDQGLSLAKGLGTTDARFGGSIIVNSGTGNFKKAQGIGTMTGSRASTLGSPVAMKFNLILKK